MRALIAATALLLLPAVGLPQSLGDAARQEAERRKKVQSEGKTAPVVSDDALEKAGEARHRTEGTSDASPAASPARSPARPSAAAPRAVLPRRGSDTSDLDRERAAREQSERMWHQRAVEANARLDRARQRYDAVKGLTLTPGESLVDGNTGRTVIGSVQELQRIVAEAEAEVKAAEQALDDLAEAARREGVPPGWLR